MTSININLPVKDLAVSRSFFEAIVARPHTIVQDALAKNPRSLTIETVSDKHVLSDGRRTAADSQDESGFPWALVAVLVAVVVLAALAIPMYRRKQSV